MGGSSWQLTLKKGRPGNQVLDRLCLQQASYLEGGPLMWMIPLHLQVNKKSDYTGPDPEGGGGGGGGMGQVPPPPPSSPTSSLFFSYRVRQYF